MKHLIHHVIYDGIDIQLRFITPGDKLEQFPEEWRSWRNGLTERTGLKDVGWFFRYKLPSEHLTYYQGPFASKETAIAFAKAYVDMK